MTLTHDEFRRKLEINRKQAHKELFFAYCGYVYTIVFNRLRSCASREDIEECVCDVFADVYLSYDSEKSIDGDVSGFIGTVARNRAAEIYRKLSSHKNTLSVSDEMAENLPSEQDIVADTEKNERRRMLLNAVNALGEPDATIIIMKYYYCRSAREIAEITDLTPENVRVRSGRAVKKLKEMLKEECL